MVEEASTAPDLGADPKDPMTYIHDTPAEREAASALLADLIDEAREIAAVRRQLGQGGTDPGGLGWLPPRYVSGVHLYEEDGAWRADLTIDGLPGRPDCIGSRLPLPDRDAAGTFALSLLCDAVLAHAKAPRMPSALLSWPTRPSAFVYDGLVVELPSEAVEALLACGAEDISKAYAERRLAEVRQDLLGGVRLSTERLTTLEPGERRAFLTVCALGALKGLTGWRHVSER